MRVSARADYAVRALTNLLDRLAANNLIFPDRPVRTIRPDLRRGLAFIDAIIPLAQPLIDHGNLATAVSALEFVTERRLATLTTLRPDGTPHVVPVAFTWDEDEGVARVTARRVSRCSAP